MSSFQKRFVFNERWKLIPGSNPNARWVNNEPQFGDGGDFDAPRPSIPEYTKAHACKYTQFGPYVFHNGHVFADSPSNLRLALRRHTGTRDEDPLRHALGYPPREADTTIFTSPDDFILGLDRELYARQRDNYPQHPFHQVLRRVVHRRSYETKEEYQLMVEHYADPHPKRSLRIQAFEEMHGRAAIQRTAHTDRLYVKRPAIKLKTGEYGKKNKYGRVIVNFGTPASLQGAWVTDMIKHAMEVDVPYADGHVRFIATPDPLALAEVFDKLHSPPGVFYGVAFSDDMAFAIRDTLGRVHRFNIDISSCDKSHGLVVFRTFEQLGLGSHRATLRRLASTCQLTHELRDPFNPKRKLTLKPREIAMGSGVTLTTALNTTASLTILANIGQLRLTTADDIHRATGQLGYLLDVQTCESMADILFLKVMPVELDDGAFFPVMAIGVFLRASGACKGDLPGSGSLEERAREFQAALLRGFFSNCTFPALEVMRRRFDVTPRASIQQRVDRLLEYKMQTRRAPFQCLTDAQVLARYHLTPEEELDVLDFFHNGRTGTSFSSPGLSRVLLADYGLECHTM